MKIKLNLLKFHSFYFDKKYNNYWKKDVSFIKDNIIKIQLLKILKHFSQFEKNNQLIGALKNKQHFHEYDSHRKNLLINSIIKKCHVNLYKDIQQLFLEKFKIDELLIFQVALTSRSRLIFIIEDNFVYPIIFDLKHCFYDSKKNYDNNFKQENNEWCFKINQKEIKNELEQQF